MPDLDSIKQRLAPFGRGLVQGMIPGMAAGTINEMFHQWHVDMPLITKYIRSNRSLWDEIGLDKRKQLGFLAQKVENLDFITPEFLIDSIRKDFPGVASLFLNSPSAREWLENQINELKAGAIEGNGEGT